ncbi:hypothetical protein M8120_24720 [Microcystis aeruginosa str. Chao 1910]|uniref:hypothetical protein n=2 Tax=Microcystis TaxID=1125 RepID=UPI0022477E44|nr:hypothetical protein [Microcystis aeruginosa]UZO75877.1 hypothetical protein M8120_24720 [Microcystis aeruginosa str. Chao 1910]
MSHGQLPRQSCPKCDRCLIAFAEMRNREHRKNLKKFDPMEKLSLHIPLTWVSSQEYNDFKSYLPACTGKILASVDYLTQFVKAGITFNAWYKNFYLSLSSLTHEIS